MVFFGVSAEGKLTSDKRGVDGGVSPQRGIPMQFLKQKSLRCLDEEVRPAEYHQIIELKSELLEPFKLLNVFRYCAWLDPDKLIQRAKMLG